MLKRRLLALLLIVGIVVPCLGQLPYKWTVDTQTPAETHTINTTFSGNLPMLQTTFLDDGVAADLTDWTNYFRYRADQYSTTHVSITGTKTTNVVSFTGTATIPHDKELYYSLLGQWSNGGWRTFQTGIMRVEFDPAVSTPGVWSIPDSTINFDNLTETGLIANVSLHFNDMSNGIYRVDGAGKTYLTVHSSDSDTVRGTDLNTVVETDAGAGDVIYLMGETYDLGSDNGLVVPDNVSVIGAGMDLTIIKVNVNGSTTGAGLNPGDNSNLSDFTISNVVAQTAGVGIGHGSNLSQGSNKNFTNVRIERVKMYGYADGFYPVNTGTDSGILIDCEIYSDFDPVRSGQNGTFEFVRCHIEGFGGTGNPTFGVEAGSGGTITLTDCDVVSTQGSAVDVYMYAASAGGTLNVHSGTGAATHGGTPGTMYPVISSGASAVINLYGMIGISPITNLTETGGGVINYGADLGSVHVGDVVQRATVDSVTALQVLDADGGTPVLNVDTVNERVGIGVAAPSQALHVTGEARITSDLTVEGGEIDLGTGTIFVGNVAGNDYLRIAGGTVSLYENSVAILDARGAEVVINEAQADTDVRMESNVGDHAFFLQGSDGFTGLGVAVPGERLAVSGDIHVTTDIELGHATDTTLSRSAPGVLAVEGLVMQEQFHGFFLVRQNLNLSMTNNTFYPFTGTSGGGGYEDYDTDNVYGMAGGGPDDHIVWGKTGVFHLDGTVEIEAISNSKNLHVRVHKNGSEYLRILEWPHHKTSAREGVRLQFIGYNDDATNTWHMEYKHEEGGTLSANGATTNRCWFTGYIMPD
jgi:hypothetical protein